MDKGVRFTNQSQCSTLYLCLSFLSLFFECIPGDVTVRVIDEVAIDLREFMSSKNADAPSGTEIGANHYYEQINVI